MRLCSDIERVDRVKMFLIVGCGSLLCLIITCLCVIVVGVINAGTPPRSGPGAKLFLPYKLWGDAQYGVHPQSTQHAEVNQKMKLQVCNHGRLWHVTWWANRCAGISRSANGRQSYPRPTPTSQRTLHSTITHTVPGNLPKTNNRRSTMRWSDGRSECAVTDKHGQRDLWYSFYW